MLVILVKIDIMIVMIINVTVIKGTMKVTQLAKNAMKHGNILFLFALLVKNVPMEVPAVALIVMDQASIANYNLQPAFAKQDIMRRDLLSVVNAMIHGSTLN